MKVILSLIILLSSCTSKWHNENFHEAKKITFQNNQESFLCELEFLFLEDKIFSYVNVDNMPKESLDICINIGDEKRTFQANILQGSQRIKLPSDITFLIFNSLKTNKNVDISSAYFDITVDANSFIKKANEGFLKKFIKTITIRNFI